MEGKVLAGRFLLLELLGRGGMGSVWRARHLELDIDIAVKLMDPSLTTHSEGLARFRREAQAAAALKSPHVVQVFDYGVDGDTPYIAMELLQGESLAKRLERLRRLPIAAATPILVQVAKAVGKAHEGGIVHRDLKPENIFLVTDDENEIAKVLDFGIAKRTGTDSFATGAVQTQTGALLGTPYYMSPEQASGKKDIDYRTDIWSFGVIACECLTGRRVFEVDSLGGLVLAICTEPIPPPSQLGPVPVGFDEWFARCVNRDREARFRTVREAASALEALSRASTDGMPPRSALVSPAQSFSAPGSLNPPSAAPGTFAGTHAVPTAITVSPGGNSGRSRRLGLVAVAGVVLIGGTLFLWSTHSPSESTVSALSARPALDTAATAPLPVALPSTSTPSVSPTSGAAPAPDSTNPSPSTSATAPRAKLPTQPPSNKNRARPTGSTNSSSATPRPAPTPNATPHDNTVDLAF